MPRALPPFLLKCDVISVVMGWKAKDGRTPVTFATVLTSSWKMAKISAISVGLFFTMSAQ
jgi:hypothetical protein